LRLRTGSSELQQRAVDVGLLDGDDRRGNAKDAIAGRKQCREAACLDGPESGAEDFFTRPAEPRCFWPDPIQLCPDTRIDQSCVLTASCPAGLAPSVAAAYRLDQDDSCRLVADLAQSELVLSCRSCRPGAGFIKCGAGRTGRYQTGTREDSLDELCGGSKSAGARKTRPGMRYALPDKTDKTGSVSFVSYPYARFSTCFCFEERTKVFHCQIRGLM